MTLKKQFLRAVFLLTFLLSFWGCLTEPKLNPRELRPAANRGDWLVVSKTYKYLLRKELGSYFPGGEGYAYRGNWLKFVPQQNFEPADYLGYEIVKFWWRNRDELNKTYNYQNIFDKILLPEIGADYFLAAPKFLANAPVLLSLHRAKLLKIGSPDELAKTFSMYLDCWQKGIEFARKSTIAGLDDKQKLAIFLAIKEAFIKIGVELYWHLPAEAFNAQKKIEKKLIELAFKSEFKKAKNWLVRAIALHKIYRSNLLIMPASPPFAMDFNGKILMKKPRVPAIKHVGKKPKIKPVATRPAETQPQMQTQPETQPAETQPQTQTKPETQPLKIIGKFPTELAAYLEFNKQLAVQGGRSPYKWSITGKLPTGLAFKAGKFSKYPTRAGDYNFAVKVQDANGQTVSLQLKVKVYPVLLPDYAKNPPPEMELNKKYEYIIGIKGGKKPYRCEIAENNLPAGVNFIPTKFKITGYPKEWGRFTLTINIYDSLGQKDVWSWVWDIEEPPAPPETQPAQTQPQTQTTPETQPAETQPQTQTQTVPETQTQTEKNGK